jgi:hypothetical protein
VGVVFGIPFADNSNTLFAPGIGGRNMAAGITSLSLALLGQQKTQQGEAYRKALAIFLATWTLAGFSDSWILINTEGSNNLFTHVFNIGVLTVIASRLWVS